MLLPILGTKLFRPPTRPDVIARPRLSDRLNAGAHRKLALISAPAGFGKTTLVTTWLDAGSRPTAWLSLDAGDNDPTRFLAHLVAALQSIAPNIEALSGALRSAQSPPSDAFLTALLNELATVQGAFALVLDDYHVIESAAVDQVVTYFLDHAPSQLHLVVTTREDPRLPLARLRAGGQLTELRAADLRFNTAEAAAFLAEVMGLDLAADDIALLEARTEGWIAGLQLAAISMQGHADAAGFIASFTGSNRFVLDYLVEEVLQRQPENVQTFLLHTSVLGRMCGPLCDALLQNPEISGEETLAAIEQANLFVVPLDDDRRWYRYHHLFADLLRQRLQQRQRASSITAGTSAAVIGAAELHARASAWFEDNGLALEAFHHATAANDVVRAERLVTGSGVPLHFRGAATPVLDWLATLPASVLNEHPSLWVAYASA
ncbi:MAG TPA: hypothetical protein VFD39_05630, partial [Trueperaceae bacterium]|nr:hypothetical protein [Trueperaceae bacterium]